MHPADLLHHDVPPPSTEMELAPHHHEHYRWKAGVTELDEKVHPSFHPFTHFLLLILIRGEAV